MTNKDHYGDNQNQGEYWNELSGPKWVEEDTAMNIRMSLITDWLFKTTLLQKNQHVLDVGCGGGATTELAARAVGNAGTVDGLDISKPLINSLKRGVIIYKRFYFRRCPELSIKEKLLQSHHFPLWSDVFCKAATGIQ